jgi:hypothetical protein
VFFVCPQSNNTRLDLRGGNLPQSTFPQRHPSIETGFFILNKEEEKMKKAMFLMGVVVLVFSVPTYARIGLFDTYCSLNGFIYANETPQLIGEKIALGMRARGFEVDVDTSDPAARYIRIEKDMSHGRTIWAQINVWWFAEGVFSFDVELYGEAQDLNHEITPSQMIETTHTILGLLN